MKWIDWAIRCGINLLSQKIATILCVYQMESASLLCSNQREQSRGTPLFCDAYDSHAKAYCKRLRAVCEHVKEPKYPPDAICGFPLVEDVFTPTDRFCCTTRQKCTHHVGWERKKRGHIDVERYRQVRPNAPLDPICSHYFVVVLLCASV